MYTMRRPLHPQLPGLTTYGVINHPRPPQWWCYGPLQARATEKNDDVTWRHVTSCDVFFFFPSSYCSRHPTTTCLDLWPCLKIVRHVTSHYVMWRHVVRSGIRIRPHQPLHAANFLHFYYHMYTYNDVTWRHIFFTSCDVIDVIFLILHAVDHRTISIQHITACDVMWRHVASAPQRDLGDVFFAIFTILCPRHLQPAAGLLKKTKMERYPMIR